MKSIFDTGRYRVIPLADLQTLARANHPGRCTQGAGSGPGQQDTAGSDSPDPPPPRTGVCAGRLNACLFGSDEEPWRGKPLCVQSGW